MCTRMFAVATVALLSVAAFAQETEDRPGRERGGRFGPGGPPGPNFEMLAQRLAEQLDLDEQQQASYDEVLASFKERFEGQQGQFEQMRDLARQMREARQAGDDARVDELRQQMEEARRGGEALREEFFKQVEPILRPEQVERMATIRERFAGGPGGRFGRNPMQQVEELRDALKLDEEQGKQFDGMVEDMRAQFRDQRGMGAEIRPIVEELRQAAEAGDDEKVAELRAKLAELRTDPRQMFDQFYADLEKILNPEQVKTLQEFRARQPGPMDRQAQRMDVRTLFREAKRLELTPEQADELKTLEEEAGKANREVRRDRQNANAAQAELFEKTKQQIAQILTPEQKEKFEQSLDRGNRERGRRPAPAEGGEGERRGPDR